MAPVDSKKFRAVALLDRDGTINDEVDYLSDPSQLRLLPGAARAIKMLAAEGIACVVTTNQSGIPRGYFTEETLHAIHAKLIELLAAEGAAVDAIYHAASLPKSGDPRRKPQVGMYREAVRDLGLQGLPVYSIGDRTLDVAFGVNCGGKGIRVLTGHQLKEDLPYDLKMAQAHREKGLAFTAENLLEAVHLMLSDMIVSAVPDDLAFRRKFADLYTTARAIEAEREQGNRVVLANGCFDVLHGGHISYLEAARSAGDRLVLAVNSNASIKRLKGHRRPLFSEPDRLAILAALECVDYLTIFHEDAADYVLEALKPNVHAKGTDYTSENVPERLTAKRLGIETVITGNAKENSTRDIIDVVVERAKAGILG